MERETLILMYHDVPQEKAGAHLYDVTVRQFKEQMELLKMFSRARVPGVEPVADQGNKEYGQIILPNKMEVVLTFDDGYESWVTQVLPVLEQCRFRAHFFVCFEYLHDARIAREDIVSLHRNGMLIGSHSLHHSFLSELPSRMIYHELYDSKRFLEDIIGAEVKYFSVPRGAYNETVLRIAKELGYEHVFTSDVGINQGMPFILKRVALNRNTRLSAFTDIVNGKTIEKIAFQQKWKDKAKTLLGISTYNRLRKMLLPRAE
jgi:peptidoglycan/xylan/chitin deacetylase (PgdA/CDA1 family)